MDFKEICKKKILGVPISGPLENVEIYFSKFDQKIFASDTIAESFYTNKMRNFYKKMELKTLRFDQVMSFSVAPGFFPKFSTKISNGDEINVELLSDYFCMGPTIIYCFLPMIDKHWTEDQLKDLKDNSSIFIDHQ